MSEWKNNLILKKGRRYYFSLLRPFLKKNKNQYSIMCNSFPKSGTHLLTQLFSYQEDRDYGNFISSVPSFTMKEKSENELVNKINHLFSKELVSAHLHWSEKISNAIIQNKIVHFFIYRDPRDVILSECNYLTNMNKWHRLHKYFKNCNSLDEQIKLSINGIETDEFYYPNIQERMKRYTPWINDNNTLSLRYEDLYLDSTDNVLSSVHEKLLEFNAIDWDQNKYLKLAKQFINPTKSHTFHSGGKEKWKESFSEENLKLFYETASEELSIWKYEL